MVLTGLARHRAAETWRYFVAVTQYLKTIRQRWARLTCKAVALGFTRRKWAHLGHLLRLIKQQGQVL